MYEVKPTDIKTIRFARQDVEVRVHHEISKAGTTHHVSEDGPPLTWCGKDVTTMFRVGYRVDCKRCKGFSVRCRDCLADRDHKDRPLGLDI